MLQIFGSCIRCFLAPIDSRAVSHFVARPPAPLRNCIHRLAERFPSASRLCECCLETPHALVDCRRSVSPAHGCNGRVQLCIFFSCSLLRITLLQHVFDWAAGVFALRGRCFSTSGVIGFAPDPYFPAAATAGQDARHTAQDEHQVCSCVTHVARGWSLKTACHVSATHGQRYAARMQRFTTCMQGFDVRACGLRASCAASAAGGFPALNADDESACSRAY